MKRQMWISLVTAPMLIAALAAPSFAAAADQPRKAPAPYASTTTAKSATPAKSLVDINSATREQLALLPGVGDAYAQKIVDGRPYKAKADLKSKKVVPDTVYNKISKLIVAKQAAK